MTRLVAALRAAGFAVVDVVDVPEPTQASATRHAEWIATMRHADSLLTALHDDEIAAGIATLQGLGDTLLPPLALTLVTAEASG